MKKQYIFISFLILSLLLALLFVSCGDGTVESIDGENNDFGNKPHFTSAIDNTEESSGSATSINSDTFEDILTTTDVDVENNGTSNGTDTETEQMTSVTEAETTTDTESAESSEFIESTDKNPFEADGDSFKNDNDANYNDAWN